jgi:hypothetical protein
MASPILKQARDLFERLVAAPAFEEINMLLQQASSPGP